MFSSDVAACDRNVNLKSDRSAADAEKVTDIPNSKK
jgi:hypothetical protein